MLEILPESQGNILGVKATGKLTKQEFQEVLVPRLKAISPTTEWRIAEIEQ